MPFGVNEFGPGKFGRQLDQTATQFQPFPPPAAILIDPLARDAVLDENGRVLGMDADDQKVVLSFSVPRKSVRHASNVGNDFATMPPLSGAALQAECERRAAAATPFDSLIASGRVTLLGVSITRPKPGETRIVVRYKKLGQSQVRSVIVGTT